MGLVLLASLVSAQTLSKAGEFDAADIKVNHSGVSANAYFIIRPGGVFQAENARVAELFQYAFKVRRAAIANAPNWFDNERVDIIAKSAPGTSNDQIRTMVQSLLVRTFRVALHVTQRDMNAFVLVLAKGGPTLRTSSGTGEADCERVADQSVPAGMRRLVCTHMTVSTLADGLPDLAPNDFDKPVVDQTGLSAAYDFSLEWAPRKKGDDVVGATIFTAVEKLGLRIEQRKVPLPTIVLDHIEQLRQM